MKQMKFEPWSHPRFCSLKVMSLVSAGGSINFSWLESDIFLNPEKVCMVRKLSFVVVSKDGKLTCGKRKERCSFFKRQVLECKVGATASFFL